MVFHMAGFEVKAFPLITCQMVLSHGSRAIEGKEILQWQLEFPAPTVKNSAVLAEH